MDYQCCSIGINPRTGHTMTAPWLAPDGRPWGERERGQGVPMALSLGYLGLVQYRPNRTSMAWAVRHLCASFRGVRARRLNGALWRWGWTGWPS